MHDTKRHKDTRWNMDSVKHLNEVYSNACLV